MEHLSNQSPNDRSGSNWANRVRPPSAKPAGLEGSGFYDVERQQGSWSPFINFCLNDGSELALPTSDLEAVCLKSAGELRLFFGATIISIHGQNLKPLHTQLLRRKVKEIREYPRDVMHQVQEGELSIESILMETKYL